MKKPPPPARPPFGRALRACHSSMPAERSRGTDGRKEGRKDRQSWTNECIIYIVNKQGSSRSLDSSLEQKLMKLRTCSQLFSKALSSLSLQSIIFNSTPLLSTLDMPDSGTLAHPEFFSTTWQSKDNSQKSRIAHTLHRPFHGYFRMQYSYACHTSRLKSPFNLIGPATAKFIQRPSANLV